MIKYFCDICGKESIKQRPLVRILIDVLKFIDGSFEDYNKHICFKCEKEIVKTLNNKIKELRSVKK